MSSGTRDRDLAMERRAQLLAEIRGGKIPGKEARGPALLWDEFRRRYEEECLVQMSAGSQRVWRTAANHYERLMSPKRLVDFDKAAFSRLKGKLIAEGKANESVASYLRTLRAGLSWAETLNLIDSVPTVRARRGIQRKSEMRSRPTTEEEFERVIMAVDKIRPKDAEAWRRYIWGLRLSTLRLDELRRLSWDSHEPLSIWLEGSVPLIRMLAEGHKSRRDMYLPVSRSFWELIDIPGLSRRGHVFLIPNGRGGQTSMNHACRVISAIGKRAGVITDSITGKTATSHDLGRRMALTEISRRRPLSEVQQLARHSDPRTTTQYYIQQQAEELAQGEGWAGYEWRSALQRSSH